MGHRFGIGFRDTSLGLGLGIDDLGLGSWDIGFGFGSPFLNNAGPNKFTNVVYLLRVQHGNDHQRRTNIM